MSYIDKTHLITYNFIYDLLILIRLSDSEILHFTLINHKKYLENHDEYRFIR